MAENQLQLFFDEKTALATKKNRLQKAIKDSFGADAEYAKLAEQMNVLQGKMKAVKMRLAPSVAADIDKLEELAKKDAEARDLLDLKAVALLTKGKPVTVKKGGKEMQARLTVKWENVAGTTDK